MAEQKGVELVLDIIEELLCEVVGAQKGKLLLL